MARTGRGSVLAILSVGAWLVTGAAPGFGAAETPSAFIERLGNQVVETLDTSRPLPERRQTLAELFRETFDLDTIGRLVLGRFWQTATPEQRTAYQEAFADFVVQTYSQQLADNRIDDFAITGTRALDERDTLVETVIEQPGQPPATFGWRVRRNGDRLKLVDVVVDGVSLVISKRSEFASVVRREGMDGLIRSLRTKTARAAPA